MCVINIAYKKENCNDLFKEWGLGASRFFSMGRLFVGADDADFTDSVTSLNHPARSEIRVIRA